MYILYFNPPWNATVSTDIARKTFKIVDDKKTKKVAYSTTRNIEHIKGHNRNVMNKSVPKNRSPEVCNCQERNLPCFAGGTEEAPRWNVL